MPSFDQCPEVLNKQRTQQCGDVQTIGVSVGEDANLAIAQLRKVGCPRIDANGHGNVVHFLAGQDFATIYFPGVEDLAAQRQDGLEFLVPRLLGRTTGRVTLDQEQLGTHRVLARTIGQLAGQCRALCDALALDLLAGLEAATGVADGQFCQLHAQLGVGVEPQAESVLDHTGDERGGLAR
ncbi:hypothetical protein D3C79_768800 [compost metagenome]